MLKKLGVVTALSTALLFGGALSSVDASANTDHSSDKTYKVYYSVNGGNWHKSSQGNNSNLLNDYFKHCQLNWKHQGDQQAQADKDKQEGKQPEQTQEQPQEQQKQTQEQPKQTDKTETTTQQPAADKNEQQNESQSQGLSQYEQQVVDLTNQEREKQGLSPLKVDAELSKVAHEKSRDMSANGYFSHNSPTYGSPFDMMKQYGISYRSAGENIARGQRTPEEVVNGWMNSEGHRANILNPKFTHIGVGYVENGNYWTQEFIGK
ncbi:hypothetical protein F3157_19690 [Virgibacillus dakarensis]|uniref:SCP domain-containing protein n=1 Tax=Lentibacillus populi TaxID=1827502 RepID=A0A9W5TZS8_9BACI|nr:MULTISPECIES: CAP domain-containing protein [Bacillaceae]MBT2218290.1 hypothetical protein [Virgibacillus dakarensis]MTW87842.1 hypothetical protein [Virgibacillus dakarensis]GGB50437.1 hypothetical protein GCM10011409_30020 [Lentibacillus populi]